MPIKVCVAGATGWAGSAVARAVLASGEFELAGAIARGEAGRDIGAALNLSEAGLRVSATLADALAQSPSMDVLIDYTKPDSVKDRVFEALDAGLRVVIGTSGLAAPDFAQIHDEAERRGLGVIAAGNFSVTAALAKHCALLAARFLPSWEVIDYAHADKVDAPSGTATELAEALAGIRQNELALPIDQTRGPRAVRGATIGGAQVHSVRLPGFVIAFEALFGLPDERLTIRHDAGAGAEPYVAGTLLAAREVMHTTGLIRGLDTLLFRD